MGLLEYLETHIVLYLVRQDADLDRLSRMQMEKWVKKDPYDEPLPEILVVQDEVVVISWTPCHDFLLAEEFCCALSLISCLSDSAQETGPWT